MGEALTSDEQYLVASIKAPGDSGHIMEQLAFLIPCGVILALGLYHDNALGTVIGFGVYGVLNLRDAFRQAKYSRVFRSLIEKYERQPTSKLPSK